MSLYGELADICLPACKHQGDARGVVVIVFTHLPTRPTRPLSKCPAARLPKAAWRLDWLQQECLGTPQGPYSHQRSMLHLYPQSAADGRDRLDRPPWPTREIALCTKFHQVEMMFLHSWRYRSMVSFAAAIKPLAGQLLHQGRVAYVWSAFAVLPGARCCNINCCSM